MLVRTKLGNTALILVFFASFIRFATAQVTINGAQQFCAGDSITLTTTPNTFASYVWSNGQTSPAIRIGTGGVYRVTVTDFGGLTDTASITITENQPRIPNIVGTPYMCNGRQTYLSVSNNYRSYSWSSGATTADITVTRVGTYSVTVQDENNCTASDTVTVSDATLTNTPLQDSITICAGDSVVLDATASGTATYYWNNTANTSSITVFAAGMYNVIITNGQCVAYDTAWVKAVPKITVNLGADSVICKGDSLRLVATYSPLYQYQWQDSSRNHYFWAKTAGTYNVKVNLGTCEARDTVKLIYFNEYPLNTIDTTTCDSLLRIGGNILTAKRYRWENGDTNSIRSVRQSGFYHFIATNDRCYADYRYNVRFLTKPKVDLGKDTILCRDFGSNVYFLKAEQTSAATYKWSNNTDNPNLSVTNDGLYAVTVTNACGTSFDAVGVQFKDCAAAFVPTAFSPNGDNTNDFLMVYPSPTVRKINRFAVFDRWGGQVFEALDFLPADASRNAWDGKLYNSSTYASPSVYVWILEVETQQGEIVKQAGEITIIR